MQEVTTLVNEIQDAGYKSVEWDARLRPSDSGGLASGVYFYRLQAVSTENYEQMFTQVRKMCLIR